MAFVVLSATKDSEQVVCYTDYLSCKNKEKDLRSVGNRFNAMMCESKDDYLKQKTTDTVVDTVVLEDIDAFIDYL